ncbi:glycosyl transferase [Flavobacterium crocinum]|uniref:Glycosyl transferase n=1 Tax=Flavobacterium crocinum TaxID=2183896 RepID=A0A2S1YG10_9FLAO|nr:glycosyltransferase [Flavobacterium crocinum]AWK02987.1 glycosyl transferase [Flavobacterium crocinum]
MITIVLTNRNRDIQTIKNCLNSLQEQANKEFTLFFVDYGSSPDYLKELKKVIENYPELKFISCPVSGQLWNKSRAINIALQRCTTPYFFVGDVDMLFHTDFIQKLNLLTDENSITYFQVGFLNKKETFQNKGFEKSKVAFKSQKEATGMSLYPTHILKSINGYDEFYHGWGAEDTDVHVRLFNLGIQVKFYDKEILLKHQWHTKIYRTGLSKDPFHFKLEKINNAYLQISKKTKQRIANKNSLWGKIPKEEEYNRLNEKTDFIFDIAPEDSKINALISHLCNFEHKIISVIITDVSTRSKIKQFVKKMCGKKYLSYLKMRSINDLLLHEIIMRYRNLPYQYSYDERKKVIEFKIYFS